MKRILVFAVVLALLTAMLSGCADQQEPSVPTNGANNSMFMTIAETSDSCGCSAFEYREPGQPYCFYAYDLEGKFYRVLWDMPWEGLHEKDLIFVDYTGEIREIDEWKLDGGYTPQYEITATRVQPEREVLAACLTHGDDGYTLTLPQSGKTLTLTDPQTRFLPYITDALVAEAESKLTQEASGFVNHSGFFLQIQEDHLCLVFEVIRQVDDPEALEEDHEHLFRAERISTQAVPTDPGIEIGIKDHTKSFVTYCSGNDQTAAMSSLLWALQDNGDGSFTETTVDKYDIVDLVNGNTHVPLPELEQKIPTLRLDGDVTAIVPVNGEILRVRLLAKGENGFSGSESSFEALSALAPGIYYVVVDVSISGNCDPDAQQHSAKYEDVFRLEVEEGPHTGQETPAQTLPSEMPDDFAIRFSAKYLAEEFYDTYTGAIQKDLIENGTISAPFLPSEETLREIYAKVLEYQICAIARSMTNDELADEDGLQFDVSPNCRYEITITADGNTYLIRGDDTAQGYMSTDADAKNFLYFVSFMRKTVSDTPEYQNLPDAVGGYE